MTQQIDIEIAQNDDRRIIRIEDARKSILREYARCKVDIQQVDPSMVNLDLNCQNFEVRLRTKGRAARDAWTAVTRPPPRAAGRSFRNTSLPGIKKSSEGVKKFSFRRKI